MERYRHEEWALGGFGGTVPIPDFLDGNFSALLGNGITWDDDGDPATPEVPLQVQTTAGATVNLQQGMIFDPQSPGQVFPGNIIPTNRISTPATVITDIYRTQYSPMRSGLTYNTAGVRNGSPKTSTSNLTLKVDHNFSDRLRLASSYVDTWGPNLMSNSQYGGIWNPNDPNKRGGPLSWTEDHGVRTNQFRFSPTYSFAPNVLNTTTLTYLRYHNQGTGATAGGGWPEKMGFGEVGIGTIPEVSFGGGVNGVWTDAIGSGSSWLANTNIYMINNALSWVKGRHTAKFGGDLRFMQLNTQAGFPSLRFKFSNTETGAPGQPYADQVGFGFASFLLGDVSTANKRVPFSLYGRRKSYSLWAQDDFKVNRKLTLTLDLRWEATGPLTEKYGHWANFNYTKMNNTLGIPGALDFAGDGKTSFMTNRDWKEFSPHVGVAYQLTPRSVLRASYGIFYSPLGLNFNNGVPYGFAPGYQGTNEWTLRSDGLPAFNWSNGYPDNFIPGTLNPDIIQSTMVRIDPDSLKAGYIQQWNAGVEFELTQDTRLGIQYMGNKGSRLHGDQFEYNQANRQAYEQLLTAGTAWNWVWDEPSAEAAGVPFPYPGFVGLSGQALAPFPQIAGNGSVLYVVGVPKGKSDYQSLQVSLTRRASRGVSAEASYTLGRARSNADNAFETNSPWYFMFQDLSRLDEEAKVPAGIDQRHVFKGYVSWDLPFGKGRSFLSNSGRIVNGLVGGWTASTVFLYASGQALGIQSSSYWPGGMYNIWSSLPGWVGQPYANVDQNGYFFRQFDSNEFNALDATAASNRYFETSFITDPPAGQFGSGPRALAQLRGFGAARENIGILKNFPITERMRLQFRMELLNIFNRHEFWNPDMYPTSGSFGNVTTVGSSPRIGQFGARFEW